MLSKYLLLWTLVVLAWEVLGLLLQGICGRSGCALPVSFLPCRLYLLGVRSRKLHSPVFVQVALRTVRFMIASVWVSHPKRWCSILVLVLRREDCARGVAGCGYAWFNIGTTDSLYKAACKYGKSS